MNKKILLGILVLILVIIFTTPTLAARGSSITPSLDMLSDILTYELTIPHPANYGSETVLLFLAIAIGMILYFLFYGLSKKFLERMLGSTESIHRGIAVGLALTSIFAAPVIEQISHLIAFFFGGATIIGLVAIIVALFLMGLSLKGFWSKQRSVQIAEMSTSKKAMNDAIKELRADSFLNDDPAGMLTQGETDIDSVSATSLTTLADYTQGMTKVVKSIPRFDVSNPNFKAIANIFKNSKEGKDLLEKAEIKLSEIQHQFETNFSAIAEVVSMDGIITKIKTSITTKDFDQGQIRRLNKQIQTLEKTRKKFVTFFDALIKDTKTKIRDLRYNAGPNVINSLHKEVAGNLESAEELEKKVKKGLDDITDAGTKITQENEDKLNLLKSIAKDFIDKSGLEKNGDIGSTDKATFKFYLKNIAGRKHYIKFTQGTPPMNFTPFMLTYLIPKAHLTDIAKELNKNKASSMLDPAIKSKLNWVFNTYKDLQIKVP